MSAEFAERHGISSKAVRDIWNLRTWTTVTKPFWTQEDKALYHRKMIKKGHKNEQPALCLISRKACSGNGTNDHARHESLPTKQHRKNETWSARGAGAAWPIEPDVPAANEDARSAIADYWCASNGSELPDFPGPIQATYNNMGLARDSPFPRKFPCSFTDPFTSLCTSADAPTHDLSIDFMRYDLALRGPTCDKTLKGLDPQVCPNPQGEASLLSCRHPLRAASRGPPVGCVTAADNVMTVSPVSSWHDESCARRWCILHLRHQGIPARSGILISAAMSGGWDV
jgi:hypothetical protein